MRTINNRAIDIVEYNIDKDCFEKIPNEGWVCILLVNHQPKRYVSEVIAKIIEKDVCYISVTGSESEKVHDLIDEEIVYREVGIEDLYLPNHQVLTTWHTELEEGIWFGIFAAQHKEVEIKNVIILDVTDGTERENVRQILSRIATED